MKYGWSASGMVMIALPIMFGSGEFLSQCCPENCDAVWHNDLMSQYQLDYILVLLVPSKENSLCCGLAPTYPFLFDSLH